MVPQLADSGGADKAPPRIGRRRAGVGRTVRVGLSAVQESRVQQSRSGQERESVTRTERKKIAEALIDALSHEPGHTER